MIGTLRAAGEEDRLLFHPTTGPEKPDRRQRAGLLLLAPPLTVRETEIAEIGRRLRRTVEALREDDPPPAG